MSINVDGVKIKTKSKNRFFIGFLILAQFVLSLFVYMSFAAHMLWPEKSSAVAGISQMISYEGYLTDTSGNPLGLTGEPYCFRFSVYDNANLGQGTKLWPTGTPATTKATTTEGVFSALIGQADALTYNFYDNDSVYLNVEVNTATSTCAGSWETLGPRQQIVASGFSIASESVYGDILRTDISNNRAQIGTGAGGASPKYLGLDVKNTTDYIGSSCTTSGTVWYNSAISKALVCENGTIQALSNAGTSTIAAITTNSGAGGYATTGTIVFSNSNGVTFGINGNTITASVAAAGGGNTYYSTALGNVIYRGQSTVQSFGQNTIYIFPEVVNAYVAASAIKMPVSISAGTTGSSSGRVGYTAQFGVYTRHATNSTILSLHYSTSYTLAKSNSSNNSMALSMITAIGNSTSYNSATSSSAGVNLSSLIHSNREFIMPWNTTLAPGEYWFAVRNSSSLAGTSNGVLNISFVGATALTNAAIGVATSVVSGNNIARNVGLGSYSVTSGDLPNSINMTQVARAISNPIPTIYMLSVTQ